MRFEKLHGRRARSTVSAHGEQNGTKFELQIQSLQIFQFNSRFAKMSCNLRDHTHNLQLPCLPTARFLVSQFLLYSKSGTRWMVFAVNLYLQNLSSCSIPLSMQNSRPTAVMYLYSIDPVLFLAGVLYMS